MKLSRACDRAIQYGFYLLFFLVPLMMTPFNYELFEYNKMMLVYFLTTIIVSAWLVKMVIEKRVVFRRSFMDIPLLIFLTSQFASTLLSIDRHTSLWGYYSRFHGGLLSTIAYLLLYWAFVTNLDKDKTLSAIRYTLISATLVSLYGIAEHFGIDAKYWVQDVQSRVFSTLGQPNWLSAWLVAIIPLPIAMLISERKKRHGASLIPFVLIAIFYLCLLYTQSRSGLLGFGVAYIVFWGLIFIPNLIKRKKYTLYPIPHTLKQFLLITILLSLITITVGTPFTPSLGDLIKKIPKRIFAAEVTPAPIPAILRGGTESAEIRRIVWKGAVDIWRHYPFFGSGVETFAYSYYQFRPAEHNLISEWDFLYNKAHNEYFNFAATTGTVGLLAYLGMIGTFIGWSLKNLKCQISNVKSTSKKSKLDKKILDLSCSFEFCTLSFAFLAGYASILVTNFFGFSVVPVGLFFFLFPAMSVVLVRVEERESGRIKETAPVGYTQYLAITVVLLFTFCVLILLGRFWYADALFARSNKLEKVGDYSSAFELVQKAISLNPGEPLYYDGLSFAAANLAVTASEQNQTELSNQLVNLAISSSSRTLSVSSRNMNFWKTRAKVFYKLAQIEEKYLQGALETLLAASELAPTDAKIFYNLGLVYLQLDQAQEAIKTLEKTVEMKADYQNARYALALLYEQEGKIQEAIEQLEYILTYIHPGHPEANIKIKELRGE